MLYWAESAVKTSNKYHVCKILGMPLNEVGKIDKICCLNHWPLRQRSELQLNRKVRWDQHPPNMADYNPECLKNPASGTFAMGPPEAEEPNPSGKKRPSSQIEAPTPKSIRTSRTSKSEAEGQGYN